MRISDWGSDVCSSDLFANRQTPQPERFLELHLLPADSESFDHGPGETIQLGRRSFKVQTFCLAWQGGGAPKDVEPYLAMVEEAGFELSQEDRKSTRLNSSH